MLRPFAPVFSGRVWPWATTLLVGAILAPGPRTVAAAVRALGLQEDRPVQNYHRGLNRARWSSRALCPILLAGLVRAFVPAEGTVLVGLDDTIERRRGVKIAAKGIYRDAVRSSKEHFVKTSGLRWVSLQLLARVPWAQRVWALPFMTVLAPSERYHQERGQPHKTLTDWGRQGLLQLRRWLPDRYLVAVADNTYAALDLLDACARLSNPVVVITRWRLDAALYDPAPARPPGTVGRPRKKGQRQPTLAERLQAPQTPWQAVTVCWYGGTERAIEDVAGESKRLVAPVRIATGEVTGAAHWARMGAVRGPAAQPEGRNRCRCILTHADQYLRRRRGSPGPLSRKALST